MIPASGIPAKAVPAGKGRETKKAAPKTKKAAPKE